MEARAEASAMAALAQEVSAWARVLAVTVLVHWDTTSQNKTSHNYPGLCHNTHRCGNRLQPRTWNRPSNNLKQPRLENHEHVDRETDPAHQLAKKQALKANRALLESMILKLPTQS